VTIYCKKCGAPNEDDALYCENCGAELEKGVPKEARGKKGIGDILSEALDTIGKNPMIIVLYLIPMVLSLIGVFVAWGRIAPIREISNISDFSKFDYSMFYKNALALIGFSSILGIIAWIVGIIAAAIAIYMTYNSVQGKQITLSEAWNAIKGKILILIIASIITAILIFLGFFALCIGALIVMILLVFVNQGIVIDNLDIGATFHNSYNIAKSNFFDILILLIIFFVLGAIVGWIPYIGVILSTLIEMYGVVTYTILYLNRKP